jgi:hypothetical protein
MHNFSTILIDEIPVEVYFDYDSEEKETHDCPGTPFELIIETVLIDGHKDKDVLFVLNDKVIENLELECEKYMLDEGDPNEPD